MIVIFPVLHDSVMKIKLEKIWGTGLVFEKTEALLTKLNERAETAISNYSIYSNFYNAFILCMWLRIIRGADQGV